MAHPLMPCGTPFEPCGPPLTPCGPPGQLLATLLALLRRVALLVAKLLMPADVNH